MDKCSCLNPEALVGVLKTVYLFLESQNFRETCQTFLSESRGMGYEKLMQAIACILILKPRAEMLEVGRLNASKTDVDIETDVVRDYDDTVWPNVYYGEPVCLRSLKSDTLSTAEKEAGICPCKETCRVPRRGVQTIDNSKNDIETQKVLARAVEEEVKLASSSHQMSLEVNIYQGDEDDDNGPSEISCDGVTQDERLETIDENVYRPKTSEIQVKIMRSSSAVASRSNVALKGDDKEKLRPVSVPSAFKTNVQVREGDLAEEVEVVVHTDDNKQSQPVQETNVKTGPSVLQNVPFVESEPFISRTTLPISNNHKALQPTSSVRFDLDGHIYAVSRETQVAESQDATVITETIVEEIPSSTLEGGSTSRTTHRVVVTPKQVDVPEDARTQSTKSVVQENVEEQSSTKLQKIDAEPKDQPFACKTVTPLATEKKLPPFEDSETVLQLTPCLERSVYTDTLGLTKSAHTSAGYDAVERSASTGSLNAQYNLDYTKVKRELRWGCPSVRAVLLQALRWRLTRSNEQVRNEIMADYARHDLLSLHGAPKSHTTLVEEFLCGHNGKFAHQHEEGMARMVNAMASLTMGRDYLCQDHTLLTKLIIPLIMKTHPSKVELSDLSSDYLWVALQKLSLRNNMRLLMIQSGLAEYLVTFLSQNHNLVSDYCLEYCLALFMNLCLHGETRQRLRKKSRDTVKFISDFLSANHDACLPYVNGAMYSLFMDSDIRKEAKHGHLDTKISEKSKFVDDESRLQLEVICDVLNTNKPGPECNTCDCIDQDDEVDHLEPEIEYGDVVHGMPDGENLLSLYRGESILPESLTVPLTCICRPATPCKRITATERCPLSPDCERQLLESESTVKASCFGLCKKSTKGQETVWDEETMLASEMCPGSDYVCCDEERFPVKEPSHITSQSQTIHPQTPGGASSTIFQKDKMISVVMEKPAISPIISNGSRKSINASKARSVTLPPSGTTSVVTVTASPRSTSGVPRTVSVECRIEEPVSKASAPSEVYQMPSDILSTRSDAHQVYSSHSCGTGKPSCTACEDFENQCEIDLDQEGASVCRECCGHEMTQISANFAVPAESTTRAYSMRSLPGGVESTISKRDFAVSPSVISKKSVGVPEEEISVVVKSTHTSISDGESCTVITAIVKSQHSGRSGYDGGSIADTQYTEPASSTPAIAPSSQSSFIPVDREESFLRDDLDCAPTCRSGTEIIEAAPQEEIPVKKATSSGGSDNLLRSGSSKTARRSSCKSSRSPSSRANIAPPSRSTFRSSDKMPTLLKDNIQCDVVCPGRSDTITEIPQDDSSSKKRASPGCCAKRRPTEPPDKSVFPKCKYDTCRRDNVPPSFTRTTINQQSRPRFQYNPCDQCADQSYTCKPYIFSKQTNSYHPFRPYCYNVTKSVCTNPNCVCPNDTAQTTVACGPCPETSVCSGRVCAPQRSKYACDCYNNLKQFSQSADLNRICRRSFEVTEETEKPKEGDAVSTPEAEFKTLVQALTDSNNLCELGIHETYRYIDCECYTIVFQSRPKLQRTP